MKRLLCWLGIHGGVDIVKRPHGPHCKHYERRCSWCGRRVTHD